MTTNLTNPKSDHDNRHIPLRYYTPGKWICRTCGDQDCWIAAYKQQEYARDDVMALFRYTDIARINYPRDNVPKEQGTTKLLHGYAKYHLFWETEDWEF